MGIKSNQRVRPKQLCNGNWVLYLYTYVDDIEPGVTWLPISKKQVWPITKLSNGRGKQFKTFTAAREYHRDYLKIQKEIFN